MMSGNPLVTFATGNRAAVPLAELKQHVLLYIASPPGPKTARCVMDLYYDTWGDPFRSYASTTFGSIMRRWDSSASRRFFADELPNLRRYNDWGYAFSDDRGPDSWMMMFHGYRPFSEAGKASFFRFEFDWQVEPRRIKAFVRDLLGFVVCMSGNAGFMFQGQPLSRRARASFNEVYAWAKRYWGVEVQDLDATVNFMLNGYKTINWITVIGENLLEGKLELVELAKRASYHHEKRSGGFLFQASERPLLGDVNRQEALPGYTALAEVLKPLQVKQHEIFGGDCGSLWTEESTNAWLRRFTDPDRWKAA